MRLAFLFAVVCAVPAMAQDAAAQTSGGDKAAVTFNEIERGLYLGVGGGPFFFLNPPASSGPRNFSIGQRGQLEVGLDLGPLITVSGFVSGASNRAGADYVGYSGGKASGDFASLTFGGAARLNLVGVPDAQGVQRTWLYGRGGIGYTMFFPAPLFRAADTDPALSDVAGFAGVGVEYFTRLRHFAIGLEVGGQYLVSTGAIAFGITPTLRYAF